MLTIWGGLVASIVVAVKHR
ncbi:MAG TPA: MetS family NSS transporter small subunit [Bacillota bacterium]|nr:MetS family NSS transporter small subunit [Bacillota bacterium]HQD39762.1 MetS family NSS transporter small subunit [Bacillota bacterium]